MTTHSDLTDRLDIAEVLNRYAFAIDDKDWVALGEIFTDDCIADYGPFGTFDGSAAVVDWMAPAHVGLTTQHAMANMVITVSGDTATARSYVTVSLQPDGHEPFRVGGAYHDEFRRTGDRWQISNRSYTTIWQHGAPPGG
ncbi:MAG TPA: nuclear transport factor 2 family protein [Ilumatobacteraceae bacterium]|nr:nuclear transport factor 2 family protein [Ilumatobacteraceae bacterium]